MYQTVRPWLFKLDAEKAHELILSSLPYIPQWCFRSPEIHTVRAMGINFPHPVGLAAGFDVNGEHLDGLAKIGFSFIEVGTVTPKGQIGNPKPRMFRLPADDALVNRMGFNNMGVDTLVNNLNASPYRGILGINIGKNKDTVLGKAAEDYLYCFERVYRHASYVVINISSPNTTDLRQLQQAVYLTDLLSKLKEARVRFEEKNLRHVPIVVKISPDESEETLKELCDILLEQEVEGIIVSNTTVSRVGLTHLPSIARQGGLSGRPLRNLATSCLRLIKECVGDNLTLIGVGGIDSVESAQEKIDAGANLVQVYTGLIYQGPGLIPRLASQLNVHR